MLLSNIAASFTHMTSSKHHFTVQLLLLLSICSSSSSDVCVSQEKSHLALIAIHEPAALIQIYDQATNVQQCVDKCCSNSVDNKIAKECNAVSFYASGSRFMCVLMSCDPFDKCTWKATTQNFVAAYIKLNRTAVAIAATTTTTTTQAPTTVVVTTTLLMAHAAGDGEALPQWNIVEDRTSTTANTPTTRLPLPQPSTISLNDPKSQPAKKTPPPKPKPVDQSAHDTQLSEETTFWVVKNIYALIGVACLVCFLVLALAIAWKKYQDKQQGKPHYKQLRDYDVRVEPPASGASLLAA